MENPGGSKPRLRFAVVGCGVVSQYGHLPTIAAMADVARLSAIVDTDERALAAASRQYPSVPVFTSYREMLDRVDLDVATIATRTDSHFEIAMACLDAGLHLMIEKPPTTTVGEAYRLLEAQRKAGSICAVNFVLRYHDGNRLMKQWCDSGEIGRLRAIRIVDAWWGADHRGVYPGRGVGLLKHDGSVIVAEGIHQADLVRWFSGSEFGPLHCIGTAIHHGEYPDHLILTASLSNGVLVTIENSWAYTVRSKDGLMDRQTDLIGEDGVAKWYESLHRLVLYGRDRTEELETTEGKHFAAIYGDLIASIHAGKPVAGLPTLDDAAKAMEVVSRAEKVSRFSSVSASHPNEAATSAPG